MEKILLKSLLGAPIAVFTMNIILLGVLAKEGQEVITGIQVFIFTCGFGYLVAIFVNLLRTMEKEGKRFGAMYVLSILLSALLVDFIAIFEFGIQKTLILDVIIGILAIPTWFIWKRAYKDDIEKINKKIKEKNN